MSPTQRTLKLLRDRGWEAEVVERWIMGANIRKDLFNCIDIVAMKPGRGILGVQCTSHGAHADHRTKCESFPAVNKWLSSGGGFLLVSWGKKRSTAVLKTGKRSKKKVAMSRLEWRLISAADGLTKWVPAPEESLGGVTGESVLHKLGQQTGPAGVDTR